VHTWAGRTGAVEIDRPVRYPGLAPMNLRPAAPADLGKGYGTQMIQLALARCFADPAVWAVLIDPLATNARAHRFYERLGFGFVERRRFGADDCCVYRLERGEYERRRAIGQSASPAPPAR